jgi:hypothetical protein
MHMLCFRGLRLMYAILPRLPCHQLLPKLDGTGSTCLHGKLLAVFHYNFVLAMRCQ